MNFLSLKTNQIFLGVIAVLLLGMYFLSSSLQSETKERIQAEQNLITVSDTLNKNLIVAQKKASFEATTRSEKNVVHKYFKELEKINKEVTNEDSISDDFMPIVF